MCNYDEEYDETGTLTAQLAEARAENVRLSQLLCEACRIVFGIHTEAAPPSPVLSAWWTKHEAADRVRAQTELANLSSAARRLLAERGCRL